MKAFYILLMTLALAVTSCDKMPANGDLDGQWQLMTITDMATNTARDVSNEGTFWRFQLDLLMIHTRELVNGHTYDTAARFSHNGNTLSLTQIYIHYRDRDSLLTDPALTTLQPVGVSGCTDSYQVEQLDRKRMVLTSAAARLTFRKF